MYQNQPQAQYAQSTATPQVQQSYTVQHDFGGAASLTATLAHALSDVADSNVTDVEATVNEYVDPTALDTLFQPVSQGSQRANGHLTFSIDGYQTTIYANGLISIVPPQHPHPPR